MQTHWDKPAPQKLEPQAEHPPVNQTGSTECAAPVEIPITGELDLHTFSPRDLKQLIPAYLEACKVRGIRSIRIVHGKGTGTLRTTVHAILRQSTLVAGFRLGDEHSGGWGATIVTIRD